MSDLLGFSNIRTPSPPWVHVVRTLVPLSKCEEAASYLIKALGGEGVAKRLIGGVKWWQVRGVNGSAILSPIWSIFLNTFYSVDAQWITAKTDWEDSKRRHKTQREEGSTSFSPTGHEKGGAENEGVYDKDMDATRCILYLHGGENFLFVRVMFEVELKSNVIGGYYFGSVDQERSVVIFLLCTSC